MDLPPDDDPFTDDLSQHMVRLGLSAATQRTQAAHALAVLARSEVVDGKAGPLRRAQRALLSVLLDSSYDKAWQAYLLGALDSVFEAHPSLTDDASHFSALAAAVSFAQDRVRATKGMSAESADASLALLELLSRRVLGVAGPEADAAMCGIAAVQLRLAEGIQAGSMPDKKRAAMTRRLQRSLREVPVPILQSVYFPLWVSAAKDASMAGVGLFMAATAGREGGEFYSATVRPAAIDIYTKRVLGSKVPIEDSLLWQFQPVYADMTAEEWGEGCGAVPAAVCRYLKKAPETAARVVSVASQQMAAAGLDSTGLLGPAGGGVGAICLRLLRSTDEQARQYGVSITVHLLSVCKDLDAHHQFLLQLADALVVKGGQSALTLPGQRAAILQVLAQCRPAQPSDAASVGSGTYGPAQCTAAVVEKLIASAEKEAIAASLASASADGSYGGVGNVALLAASVAGDWLRVELAYASVTGDSSSVGDLMAKVSTVFETKVTAANAAAVAHASRCMVVMLGGALRGTTGFVQHLEAVASSLVNIVKEAAKKALLLHTDGAIAFHLLLLLAKQQTSVSGSSTVLEALGAPKLLSSILGASSFLFSSPMNQFVGSAAPTIIYQKLLFELTTEAILVATFTCSCDGAVYPFAAGAAATSPLLRAVSEGNEGLLKEDSVRGVLNTLAACAVSSAVDLELVEKNCDRAMASHMVNFTSFLVAGLQSWVHQTGTALEEQRKRTALAFKGVTADVAGADAGVADLALPCGLPSRILTVRSMKLLPPPSALSKAVIRLGELLCCCRTRMCTIEGAANIAVAFTESYGVQRSVVRIVALCCHPFVGARNSWERPDTVAPAGAKTLLLKVAAILFFFMGEPVINPKYDPAVVLEVLADSFVNPTKINRSCGQLMTYLLLDMACSGSKQSQCVFEGLSVIVENDVLPWIIESIKVGEILQLSDNDIQTYLCPDKHLNGSSEADGSNAGEIKITNADRKNVGGKRKGTAFGSAADDEMLLEKIKQDKAKKMQTQGAESDGARAQRQIEVDTVTRKVDDALRSASHAMEGVSALCALFCKTGTAPTDVALRNRVAAVLATRLAVTVKVSLPPAENSTHEQTRSVTLFPFLLNHRLTSQSTGDALGALCRMATTYTALESMHADFAAAFAVACRPRSETHSTAVLSRVIQFIDNRVVGSGLAAGMKHCSYTFEPIPSVKPWSVSPAALCFLVPILVFPFNVSIVSSVEDDTHVVMMAGGEPALRCLDWLWPDVETRVVINRGVRLFKEVIDPLLVHTINACLVAQRWFRAALSDRTVDKFLLRITSQRALTEAEWTPLLGDRGVLSGDVRVRQSCLRSVENMLQHGYLFDSLSARLRSRLCLLINDSDKECSAQALRVFQEEAIIVVDTAVLDELLGLMSHPEMSTRTAVSKAIAFVLFFAIDVSSNGVAATLTDIYTSNIPVPRAVDDNLLSTKGGKLVVKDGKDSLSKSSVGKKSAAKVIDGAKETKHAPAFKSSLEMSTPSMIFTRSTIAKVFENLGSSVAGSIEPDAVLCLSQRRPDGGVKVAAGDAELFNFVFDFVLSKGVVDGDSDVRDDMLTAGRALIDGYGGVFGDELQSRLQSILSPSTAAGAAEDVSVSDARRGAAVVLLGAAGKYISLSQSGDNLDVLVGIIDTLISALDTPAASIQKAVADCLVPLVQNVKSRAGDTVTARMTSLLTRCLEGRSYGIRRGAAYGISALAKGLGVQSLKQLDIITTLKEACAGGSVEAREGSLFAFELLSDRLGLLFEPYVISVVPILLKSFSHPSNHVREAAQGTAGAIMGRLSAHGVKQVLTPILQSLPEEAAWKSRQEALRLLGSMAHCAPRQLAACLPQIIPRLVDAGSDPHPKVKESAKEAMADISSVIRNPEVAQLSPVLLAALGDPAKKTKDALEALMVCEFMHSIDAPSLGLLVPILGRALRDRTADIKRKSAMITGNMCAMIADQSVLVPYLPQVVPELKEVLLDPIPDVRTVAAKALASLVGGVGEAHLPDLTAWLMTTMTTESSSVERSGAAQGLAEVCHALGEAKLLAVLDKVLTWKVKKAAAPREGAMWFYSFLPAVYNQGDEFMVHISTIFPVVLTGFSDTHESVREVALRAAQVLVATQGKRHSGLILPSLQSGMSDEDWRIRQNSVSLLGELMYLLSDTKAIGLTDSALDEDDDTTGISSNSKVMSTIRSILGDDKVDEVLAELYLARSDVGSTVRQNALQVWKSVVSQTPKTLVRVMPYLVNSIIRKLSDELEDRRTVAARCLSDLVRKLGDRVLPVIVPHLRNGLDSDDSSVRRGVCVGLSEILAAAGKAQVDMYIDSLLPALEVALCDETSADIRAQGAIAFQTLIKVYGVGAIDQVLPALLSRLEIYADGDNQSDELVAKDNSALLGICELVSAKPRDVLESLLPTLLTLPITATHALILKAVCPAARGHINYHFQTLVPQLIKELNHSSSRQDTATPSGSKLATHNNVKDCASVVMGAATTSGVSHLVIELGKQIDRSIPNNIALEISNRRWAMWLLAQFLSESAADYFEYLTIILRQLLSRAADAEPLVLEAILLALKALASALSPDELMPSIDFIQSSISTAYSDAKHRAQNTGTATCQLVTATDSSGDLWLPLFTIPKSLDAVMPLFIHALMNGNTAQRESAANAIGEFASFSDPAVLKPYLIKTTGPLIRVAGDRFPSAVKYAILNALCILIRKGGIMLKAFVPQLQTTFIKAFSDPSRQVRGQGATALGLLMGLNPKPDVILTELSALCANAEAAPLRASALDGITVVLSKAGPKASARALSEVALVITVCAADPDDSVRNAALHVCSEFGRVASEEHVTALGNDILQKAASEPMSGTYSATNCSGYVGSCCAAACLVGSGSSDDRCSGSVFSDLIDLVFDGLGRTDGDGAVKLAVQSACAVMFRSTERADTAATLLRRLAPLLITNIGDDSNYEVRRTALLVVKEAAKKHRAECKPYLAPLVDAILPRLLDLSMRVKKTAERTLKRLFDVQRGETKVSAAMSEFITGGACPSTDTAKNLREAFRKTLSILADASDEEEGW